MKRLKTTKPYINPKQKAVLDFVADHLLRFGYAPTQKEISKALSMPRTSVESNLIELSKKGLVDKGGPGYRNLVVTGI